MNYSVIITDTAKQDLEKIAIWIAQQSKNIDTAKKFVEELRKKCHTLDLLPERGSFPDDRILKSLGYRFIVHKEYLIFYWIDESERTVYIMSVFNGKKDYTRVFGTKL